MSPLSDGQDPPRQVLNNWQEIADYVGISVRSAQRAEIDSGLPVRRLRGRIVYADPTELDAWKRSRQAPADPPPASTATGASDDMPSSRWRDTVVAAVGSAAFVVVMLLAGAAVGRQWNAVGEAVEFRLIGRSLEGVDKNGVVAWSHRFDTDVSAIRGPGETGIQVIDVDGDGEEEVLVPTRSALDGVRVTITDGLHCFTKSGTRKWTIRPDQTLRFGAESFSAPWMIRDVVVSPLPDRRVWVAWAHHTWWPGFVVEVRPDGANQVTFVMDGRIDAIEHWVGANGTFLVAGGVSFRTAEASLVFLDTHVPGSTFPHEGDPRFACPDCPAGQPARILSFPATETAHDSSPFTWISRLSKQEHDLHATVRDYLDESIVVLNEELSPTETRLSPRRWAIHGELERAGRLAHAAADCPERRTPRRVREWTAARGWREWWLAVADPSLASRSAQ